MALPKQPWRTQKLPSDEPVCNNDSPSAWQWAHSASQRRQQAGKRYDRLHSQLKKRADELYRQLGLHQRTLERQGVADQVLRRESKEREAVIEAELEQRRAKLWRASEQCHDAFRKQERYCQQQRA